MVAEIQGLYGAFAFSELLLQKIWNDRAFDDRAALTADGRRIFILDPGHWNRLGGPDFTDARIRIEGEPEMRGDVELHLRAPDWDQHRHAHDAAYARVVLHVVLFWPSQGTVTRDGGGRSIPMLPLLPLLRHDLEEYATDEVIERLAGTPLARLTQELAVKPADEVACLLRAAALKRWEQKLRFARLRVQRFGWDAACHHAALEALGFRFNRLPMLRIAAAWPLASWPELDIAAVYASETDRWSVQGVRPANQPKTRLAQYQRWAQARPQWPLAVRELCRHLPRLPWDQPTRGLRREHRIGVLRDRILEDLTGSNLGGARGDTFLCDVVFPLASIAEAQADLSGCWYHWLAGDMPDYVRTGLRRLGVVDGGARPLSHGCAQGLLGWLIEREVLR